MLVATPERTRLAERGGLPDRELVARARAGDGRAYAAIYHRHRRIVAFVVEARLGRQGDPADAVQDVFTAAWRHLGHLRDPDQLKPWLVQIARRTAIDHGRRFRRAPVDLGDDLLDPVEDRGPGPAEMAELSDTARRIDVALAALSLRDATVISLAVHRGLGPHEIAEAMGVTPGNAKVILHRARRRLRAALAA